MTHGAGVCGTLRCVTPAPWVIANPMSWPTGNPGVPIAPVMTGPGQLAVNKTWAPLMADINNPGNAAARANALQLAQTQIKQNVQDPLPYAVAAKLSLEGQNQQEFRQTARTFVQRFPNDGHAHYYFAIHQMQDGNWRGAEESLRQAEALGMDRESVGQMLRMAIDNQKWVWEFAWITLFILAGWAIGLMLLFVAGKMLSALTLRSLHRKDAGVASFSDRVLRRAYRLIVNLAGIYYFLSLPVVVLMSIAVPLALGYALLMVPYLNLLLAAGVLILGIGGIMTALSGIRAAFVRVRPFEMGYTVSPKEWPEIWEIAGEVADKVGTRVVDEIRVVPSAQLAVVERGSTWQRMRDRGHRVLILGVGSLYDLKLDSLKAILAHEYGHFQHRDTAGGEISLQVYTAMQNFADAIAKRGKIRWWDLAVQFLRLYHFLFRRLTFGASRLQEVLADRLAVQCYGSTAFSQGLRHVIRRSVEFDLSMDRAVRDAIRSQVPLVGFYAPSKPPELADREQIEAIVEKILNRPTDADDSHPSPKDRFALAERVLAEDPPLSPRTAWDLVTANEDILLQMGELVDNAIDKEAREVQAVQKVIIDYFSSVLRQRPAAQSYFERARVHLDRGDFESAVDDFTEALEQVPDATDARFGRALTYKLMGDFERAAADFQRVTRDVDRNTITPEQTFSLYTNLGQCYQKLNRHSGAIDAYERALDSRDSSLVVLVELGRAYCGLEQYGKAIKEFTRAIELWPTSPEPYLERAMAYQATGQDEKADEDRETALKLDPRVLVVGVVVA
jgi:Tfp pilus assembly protein PilF/Zn-dependent protease with chaperone function